MYPDLELATFTASELQWRTLPMPGQGLQVSLLGYEPFPSIRISRAALDWLREHSAPAEGLRISLLVDATPARRIALVPRPEGRRVSLNGIVRVAQLAREVRWPDRGSVTVGLAPLDDALVGELPEQIRRKGEKS